MRKIIQTPLYLYIFVFKKKIRSRGYVYNHTTNEAQIAKIKSIFQVTNQLLAGLLEGGHQAGMDLSPKICNNRNMKQEDRTQLPEFLKPCFWDITFEDLKLEKSRYFILERVLDRGNTQAIKWALSIFSKDEIRDVLLTSRDLSGKTANFWAEMMHVDKGKVPCLQKPYSPIPFGPSN